MMGSWTGANFAWDLPGLKMFRIPQVPRWSSSQGRKRGGLEFSALDPERDHQGTVR